MDNTFFTGLTSAVGGTIGLAMTACAVIAALILGAFVGYRLYYRFTWMSSGGKGDSYYGSDEHFNNWKKAGKP